MSPKPFGTSGDQVEYRLSLLRLAGLTLAGVAMTAGSAALAFPGLSGMNAGLIGMIIGYIGFAFFGMCLAAILWNFTKTGQVMVTLNATGIHDPRVAAEIIPWLAIRGLSTWEYSGQKILILDVEPAVEQQLTLTKIAQLSRAPNRALGADGLAIAVSGLNTGYDEFYRTAAAFYESAVSAADDGQGSQT